MKRSKLWIAAGLVAAVSAVDTRAAEITWEAPHAITDSGSDVLRVGGRWAAERMVGTLDTVQGVTFRAKGGFTNILYSSGSVYAGDSICPDPSTPDVNDDYRSMLRGLSWQPNAGIYDITLTNLTPGTTYKVQIWCSSADQKAIGAAITWMDSVNNGNLVTIHLQNGGDGNLGEFAVGTFTADETGVQHIYGSGSDALLNGIQVRDMSLPDGTDDVDIIPEQPVPGPAAIEWEPAYNITDDFDISTDGTLFAAENIGDPASPTINGVTFDGWNESGHFTYFSTLSYIGVGAPGLSDEYTALLNGVSWDETGQFSVLITGLTPGKIYLVQTWTSSQLNAPSDERVFSIDSESGITNGVIINSNVGNGLGQYCIGRFTATSTNQMIGVEKKTVEGSNGNPSISAIQVREVEWAPDTPFQGWMATYGLTNDTPAEDSDGDGAINLYEYALNGDPTNAAVTGVDPVVVPSDSEISYVYLKRNDPSLTYSLKMRSDLIYADWQTNGWSVSEGIIDSVWTAVSNSVPLDANDTLFYDLKIEQQ